MSEKDKTVLVSGGFDPIHKGHVRLFKEASKLGDKLHVLVNNDHWLEAKKGVVFMDQDGRVEVIESIQYVDKVSLTTHRKNPSDMSICKDLRIIKPDIFANGGDRKSDNVPEYDLCEDIGIEMEFGIGGDKIESSSDLLESYVYKSIDA